MIALHDVTQSSGKNTLLSHLSLRIDPGAALCITGESGSGKSMLLRLLIRADDPESGTVEVDGVNIRTLPAPILQLYRRRVGVIFQEPILMERSTVEENIRLPLELLGAPEALIRRNTFDLLKRINVLSKASLFPRDLSVSERVMVTVARAIITAPMVILADEPLHNLDAQQKKIVTELLTNMQKKGTTLVIFSREAATGHAFGAEILHLKNGNITRQAEPESFSQKQATGAHRILEENDTHPTEPLLTPPAREEGRDAVPLLHKKTSTGGQRIRITSIGSNS